MDTKLFKAGITVDGDYVHGKQYDILTQVYYNPDDGGDGCSYVSRVPNKNIRPGTDDSVWALTSQGSVPDAVTFVEQELTSAQQAQARDNIGAERDVTRVYDSNNPNGKGYKVVADGVTLSSVLTDTNTIYEIRYEYDLSGSTLSVPAGCVLNVNGGKIVGGTINGNNTVIQAPNGQIFDNVTFTGTFCGALNATWVGAKAEDSSFNNGTVLQAWLSSYGLRFREIFFPTGTYYFTTTSILSVDTRNLTLNGCNSLFSCNIQDVEGVGQYFLVLSNPGGYDLSSGEQFRIEDLRITSSRYTGGKHLSKTRCFKLDRAQRFEMRNIQVWYFDVAITIFNTWYGGISGQTVFRENRIGILALSEHWSEVNTLEINNISVNGAPRNAIAAVYPKEEEETDAAYSMRTASVGFDAYCHLNGLALRGCVFEDLDYGVRTNWVSRSSEYSTTSGVFTIDGCYFEANNVYDIYVGSGNYKSYGSGSSYHIMIHELTISNCRFFTIKKIYLQGAKAFVLNNQPVTLDAYTNTKSSVIVTCTGDVTVNSVGTAAYLKKLSPSSYTVRARDGSVSIPATNFQKITQLRNTDAVYTRLNGYSATSTTPYDYIVRFRSNAFYADPSTAYSIDTNPLTYYYDYNNSYAKLLVPSGAGVIPVNANDTYQFRALNRTGDYSLYEFIRQWKAGKTFTGSVCGLFPFEVTADPVAGTVVTSSGTLVGFGVNALGTTVTTSTTAGNYVFVDALILARISYSKIKHNLDLVQCGRSFTETRQSIDESSSNTGYLSCYGSNANMANVQKRLNAVYFDTTNRALMIFNGYEWVSMTSPFQRYYYVSRGNNISMRMAMADVPGQTYTNKATGITYTFSYIARNSYQWIGGIGRVLSLDNPNGYSLDNTLDYANELIAGEQVVYNNKLYTWDGAKFCLAANGDTSSRPTMAATDVGYQYFDTTLGKVIVWDGTAWKNVDGTALS